jgi:ATP-dependent DNA helicase DinG
MPADASLPGSGTLADRAEATLVALTGALPRGEARPGQLTMTRAVADAFGSGRHLAVQAGTGTGKSLAYLVPAVLSGRRVVVATATKTLQDQLAGKDLPFVQAHVDVPFTFAVLKGRSNYLCRQRLAELTSDDGQQELVGLAGSSPTAAGRRAVATIAEWAETTTTGDRADLVEEPPPGVWAALSVGPRECPGAARCPQGTTCFAERARAAAAEADVVVVNLHLYGLDVATAGGILPEHDLVVVDEAHQLEDVVTDTAGFEVTPGRFTALAAALRSVVADEALPAELAAAGDRIEALLAEHEGRRLRRLDPELADALVLARTHVAAALTAARAVPDTEAGGVAPRRQRLLKAATTLADELDAALEVPPTHVAWVERAGRRLALEVAPIDVADLLASGLWPHRTAVLTSATLPAALPARLGLEGDVDELDVGSPFDFASQALLYCAAHLPDPRSAAFDDAVHDELEALVGAAGGRTLALFTSRRALDAAVEALRPRVRTPVLAQDDLPRAVLLERFADDEATSLFATMGFWQGVDVPGPSLSLVAIDRLPFPRPDEPLLQAKRERARADAFRVVDLPRAATLLAQGVGRLIRSAEDRGVVAVLDPRLATNVRYRWDILAALPPMTRTRDRDRAEALLHELSGLRDLSGLREPAGP